MSVTIRPAMTYAEWQQWRDRGKAKEQKAKSASGMGLGYGQGFRITEELAEELWHRLFSRLQQGTPHSSVVNGGKPTVAIDTRQAPMPKRQP